MKYLLAILTLILAVNCAEAQYRKPTKTQIHQKPVAVRSQPIRVVIPPNPYADTMRLYQYAQFQLFMQFQYEQQRLAYLQQLEMQRQLYWMQQGYFP